jgi:hypothetical protein
MSRSRLLPKALRTGWGALRKSAVEADEKPKKTGMLAEISGGKGSRFQKEHSATLPIQNFASLKLSASLDATRTWTDWVRIAVLRWTVAAWPRPRQD